MYHHGASRLFSVYHSAHTYVSSAYRLLLFRRLPYESTEIMISTIFRYIVGVIDDRPDACVTSSIPQEFGGKGDSRYQQH
jgi:hypothetical protein